MPPMGALRPWLTNRGSLTAKIMANFDNFNLIRLQQHLATPFNDERRALELRFGEYAVIREVILRDGATPLVFAHTAANPRDLRGAWRGLSRLGNRPLAEMLFHDPEVSRMAIEYKQLPPSHPLVNAIVAVSTVTRQILWARRSVFLKNNRPLMVTEVFLPSLIK
jgi:chorismate lyase